MVWTLVVHPAVRKDLRRLSQEGRDFLLQGALPILRRNPYIGEPLHGPLKGAWRYRQGEYRVAYCIEESAHEVIVLMVGPRGGFYEELRRRMRK